MSKFADPSLNVGAKVIYVGVNNLIQVTHEIQDD